MKTTVLTSLCLLALSIPALAYNGEDEPFIKGTLEPYFITQKALGTQEDFGSTLQGEIHLWSLQFDGQRTGAGYQREYRSAFARLLFPLTENFAIAPGCGYIWQSLFSPGTTQEGWGAGAAFHYKLTSNLSLLGSADKQLIVGGVTALHTAAQLDFEHFYIQAGWRGFYNGDLAGLVGGPVLGIGTKVLI